MSNLICITNRSLCSDDFFARLRKIASMQPKAIILREKDLAKNDYLLLAAQCHLICEAHQVPLVLNWRHPLDVSKEFGIQLSFDNCNCCTDTHPRGISIHHSDEAKALQNKAIDWLIAGHIYVTNCKAGVSPRGLHFLKEVCQVATQPVYAIGGITPDRVVEVLTAGAKGYCVMSPLMTHPDPALIMQEFYKKEGEYHV